MPPGGGTRAVELSPAALEEIGRRHGLPGLPVVLSSWTGATSTVLRLGDGGDDRLTVKVPHDTPGAVASCLMHAAVTPVARRLGVTASELLAVEQIDDVAVPVVVSRFLPGHPLPRNGAGHPDVWRAVGADLARLHSASRSQVGLELREFEQHPDVDPVHLADEAVGAGHLDRATADRVAELRAELVDAVLPDDRPVLCHGDVHTENVLVHDGRYAGLIDFAGAGWLDAAWDFATIPMDAVGPCLDGYAPNSSRPVTGIVHRIAWCRLQLALHRLASDPSERATKAVREAEHLRHRGW